MRLRFNEFELDTSARQLFRGESEVHLSPKAFELLKTLVENRPNAMSKADLHDRLWPSTFVSESNLAALINEVRTALCDDALHPRFVRTAHRFGYAFCAEAFECQSVGKAPKGGVTSYWLILETGRFELARGDNVIGRDPHATVWLDLPSISRQHARIVISDEGAHVEDLGSKNGTCIGGRRIELPERVTDHDRITFGSIDATFRIWPASSDIDTETNRDSATLSARGGSHSMNSQRKRHPRAVK